MKDCPSQHGLHKEAAVWCWRCGEALKDFVEPECSVCGYPFLTSDRYCAQCGAKRK